MVICLERDADLHMAQLMPRLTWVVPEQGPLNGCVCVCVCVFNLSGNTLWRNARNKPAFVSYGGNYRKSAGHILTS